LRATRQWTRVEVDLALLPEAQLVLPNLPKLFESPLNVYPIGLCVLAIYRSEQALEFLNLGLGYVVPDLVNREMGPQVFFPKRVCPQPPLDSRLEPARHTYVHNIKLVELWPPVQQHINATGVPRYLLIEFLKYRKIKISCSA